MKNEFFLAVGYGKITDAIATYIIIPDALNVLVAYPAARVKGAPNPAGADVFLAYLYSPAGQAVLAKWGFIPAAG